MKKELIDKVLEKANKKGIRIDFSAISESTYLSFKNTTVRISCHYNINSNYDHQFIANFDEENDKDRLDSVLKLIN